MLFIYIYQYQSAGPGVGGGGAVVSDSVEDGQDLNMSLSQLLLM